MSQGSGKRKGLLFALPFLLCMAWPVIVMAVVIIMQGESSEHGWLLPNSITDMGDTIDGLFWMIFWIVMVIFVITEGLLVWFAVKYAYREGHKALYTHGNVKVELIWTIIPAIVLAFLAVVQIPTWLDLKAPHRFPNDDPAAFEVHVLAQQFAWRFRYAGPDRVFHTDDDYTLPTLEVPKDRPIMMSMRSLDVLHALFIPHARFKQDFVPGLTMKGWFKSRESGEFPIACAELCGEGHYTMASTMRVYEPGEWAKKEAGFVEEFAPPSYKDLAETFRFWPGKGQ